MKMTPDLDVACHLSILVADAAPAGMPAALDAIAAAGFVRVVLPPLDPSTTDAVSLRRACAAAGLAPITIAVQGDGADVSSTDVAKRAAGLESLRRMVDFSHAIGSDQMNGVPYGPFGRAATRPSTTQIALAAEAVGRAADYAHEAGLTMTFEVLNRYETSMINTAAQAIEFVRLSDSHHLRIHLDTFHMGIEESDIAGAVRAAMPWLGYLELGQSGRGSLEGGALDMVELVRQVLDDGYVGRWGVEAFSRSVLSDETGDMLAIWRSTYDDPGEILTGAWQQIDRGWAGSIAGRRALRPSRGGVA